MVAIHVHIVFALPCTFLDSWLLQFVGFTLLRSKWGNANASFFSNCFLICLRIVVDLSMGLDMEFEFEKKSTSDLSPNTVLPCRKFSDVGKRRTNGKPPRKDDLLTAKEDFKEINFRRFRSSSCNIPSRHGGLEGNVVLKRGSIYQSSREVTKMKKMGVDEGRRKLEVSRDSNTSCSFSIVDSLCSSDEENTQKRSSTRKSCIEPCSSSGFIEICPNLDKRERQSAGTVRSDSVKVPTFRNEQVCGPTSDANDLHENDIALTFHKSHSVKVEMLHSPSPSESDCSSRASSKSRFSPIKKMFDPIMKSKSLRSPLGYIAEPVDLKNNEMSHLRKKQISRKSSLRDFSHTAAKSDKFSSLVRKDNHHSTVACSPVHLHGRLKVEIKQGAPHFEFSLDSPEEVFIAKTWKANNSFNWVYTFHSICSRKKSNASGWGLTDGNKESLVVGQMQVSCYLCSELKDGGALDNSMVAEFVLYDIAHARQSVSTQDSLDIIESPNDSKPGSLSETHKLDNGSEPKKLKNLSRRACDSADADSTNSYPWPSAILHSDLEIAAIVIQLPFAKRESLKYKRGDKPSDKAHVNLLSHSMVEQRRKGFSDRESVEKLKVVIPAGNHGLPLDESQGASSLLDRWRLGGVCDCGGWDMGCPLTVFGSPNINCAEEETLINNHQPLELFVQGTKQKIPALTMTAIEEGTYAVDFHAQLSTLQAFSICVAVLHGAEASDATGEEKCRQLPHCSSLKMLIEEEVQFLIEAVTKEEKKKVPKKTEQIKQSYVVNPPFSPIARV
ncbi:uncharacterized protein LOC126678692 [Mercurialis annua]|uniref:uncharacterized protein LOC126678692 n=1 Tax=Mercurialis annua TaxID=3986 RepID=UPI00215F8303|nr:uncharacterized protein LOC126678692 [Mercurialis annua]